MPSLGTRAEADGAPRRPPRSPSGSTPTAARSSREPAAILVGLAPQRIQEIAMPTDRTAQALEALKSDEKAAIGRLMEWLRIPSVSTDPAFKGDVRRAAEWAAAQLREAGFKAEIRPTPDGK